MFDLLLLCHYIHCIGIQSYCNKQDIKNILLKKTQKRKRHILNQTIINNEQFNVSIEYQVYVQEVI